MKLKIGQHDGESSKAKCNLQVSCNPFITQKGNREFQKSKICTHTQLFICHFHSSYTSSVHLSGVPHKPLSLHSLACFAAFNHIFSAPCASFFFCPNTTKLVGISCLCAPHRNILQKIKETRFKCGGKVGQGKSSEALCVCAHILQAFFFRDRLLLSGRDCGSQRSEVGKSKRSEMPVITTQHLSSRFCLFNYSSMIASYSTSLFSSPVLPFVFRFLPNFSEK